MKQFRLVKFQPKRTFGIEMEWQSAGLTRESMKRIIEAHPNERAVVTSYQRNDRNDT